METPGVCGHSEGNTLMGMLGVKGHSDRGIWSKGDSDWDTSRET